MEDPLIQEIAQNIQQGWPDEPTNISPTVREFFNYRDELVIEDNLLFKGERLYVPMIARNEVLERIHSSHIGINGCLRRAREAVFWPNMTKDITHIVTSCPVCNKFQTEQSKEPLISHVIPDRPWQIIGCDLFEYKHTSYLICVDYYSNFFEVDRLNDKRGPEVIRHIKAHMARYGISEILRSDNGPPFNSAEFRRFCKEFEIEHITSSPRYPQSNGKVENACKTIRRLMQRASEANTDPYLALLDWRNTISEGYDESPTQRILGRRVRTRFPTKDTLLRVPRSERNKQNIVKAQEKQSRYYNRNTRVKPDIPVQQTVRFRMDDKSDWKLGEISKKLPYRSYQIRAEDGTTYRRTRKHVRFSNEPNIVRADEIPETEAQPIPDDANKEQRDSPKAIMRSTVESEQRDDQSRVIPQATEIRTRHGRVVRKPARYNDSA